MRKATGTAAGEHDVDGAARDEAREPRYVGAVSDAHVMMRAEEVAPKLDVLGHAAAGAAVRMHKQQLRRRAHLAAERMALKRMERQRLIGARDQEHAIGLAQAEARPVAVRPIALIEDDVVLGLEAVEPIRGFLRGGRVQDGRFGAHLDQSLGERTGRRLALEAGLQRHQREGFGPRPLIGPPRRLPQAANDNAQEIEHDARIAG